VTRSAAALASLAIACAIGEGGDRPNSTVTVDTESTGGDVGSTGATESGDEGSTLCVPGQQIACPCPGGSEGAQACNAAGTGYEPCVCANADSGSGESTEGTTSTDTGDIDIADCSPDVECNACVNCEITNACKEQYETCTSNAACSESADCTIVCGFTQECALKCAPANDKEAAQLFNDLSLCLASVCPQCLSGG
jgi:hypothetical protein